MFKIGILFFLHWKSFSGWSAIYNNTPTATTMIKHNTHKKYILKGFKDKILEGGAVSFLNHGLSAAAGSQFTWGKPADDGPP